MKPAPIDRRLVLALPLLGVLAAAGLDDPKPAATSAPAEPDLEVTTELPALIEAHNQERKQEDLPPLEPEPHLAAAARRHALDMANTEHMAHEGSDGSTPAERVKASGYKLRRAGENVAYGYDRLPDLMKGWMESPHHRDNILGDFTQIGVARALSTEGVPYWAVVFGTPWPEPDPTEARDALLRSLNARREQAGVLPLTRHPLLDDVAQRHAHDNAQADAINPTDSDDLNPLQRVVDSGYKYRQLRLVDASGQPTADQVLESWLEEQSNHNDPSNQDDPSDPENLLSPILTQGGIGYARTSEGVPYWTLILAQPRSER